MSESARAGAREGDSPAPRPPAYESRIHLARAETKRPHRFPSARSSRHAARETRVRTGAGAVRSTRSLIVALPILPGVFRKMDAVAVLTADCYRHKVLRPPRRAIVKTCGFKIFKLLPVGRSRRAVR